MNYEQKYDLYEDVISKIKFVGLSKKEQHAELDRVRGKNVTVTVVGYSEHFTVRLYQDDGQYWPLSDEFRTVEAARGFAEGIGKFLNMEVKDATRKEG